MQAVKKASRKCRILSIARSLVRRVSREGNESELQEAVMARHHTLFLSPKSIVGTGFVELGVLVLLGNLTVAASRLGHLLGVTGGEVDTLGLLTATSIVFARVLQAYLFDHTEFLRVLHQILLSFWPLLLVIVGTVLLRAGFTDEHQQLSKKMITGHVDFSAPRSTRK
jgi:hypothetical protein